MADVITARLSQEIPAPELSRMWEAQRIDVMLPEVVIETWGRMMSLRFQGVNSDPGHRKLRAAFVRAVKRYRPDCEVEWVNMPARAS